MLTISAPAGFLVLVAFAAYGAWSDITRRLLPNLLCLLVALAGALVTFADHGLPGLGSAALHMLIALGVGMVLFRFGMIGAGDAKFYSGNAMWFGLGEALRLLLAVSISGAVLLLVWVTIRRLGRRLQQRPVPGGPLAISFAKLPYGVAIAAGAVLAKSGLY